MRSYRRASAASLVIVALLGGCAFSATPDGAASSDPRAGMPTSAQPPTSAHSATVIDVTVNGDEISPNGERIDVRVGEPVTLRVVSDREGELHVHSTPEQELHYDDGVTTLTLTIDRPGIVEVEDHVAGLVVVQLQVS